MYSCVNQLHGGIESWLELIVLSIRARAKCLQMQRKVEAAKKAILDETVAKVC